MQLKQENGNRGWLAFGDRKIMPFAERVFENVRNKNVVFYDLKNFKLIIAIVAKKDCEKANRILFSEK